MTLKVIGAGFGRTGTASLKLALDKLGFGPCYHMSEVLANEGHMDLWNSVADGAPDWDEIFKNYNSTTDFPASTYWRELAAYYPDAKIILSLRDAERWFESTQETILSPMMMKLVAGTPWKAMLRKTIDELFDGKIHDHDTLIRVFNEHNAAVKAAFGPDRLLVFEAKHGWEPLCKFLGVPVPKEDFPRVNSKDELQGMMDMLNSDMGRDMMAGMGCQNKFASNYSARINRRTMQIREDDLSGAKIRALLEYHHRDALKNSPPGTAYVLDIAGLSAPDISFWSAWDGEDLLGCGAMKERSPDWGEVKSMRTHLIMSAKALVPRCSIIYFGGKDPFLSPDQP